MKKIIRYFFGFFISTIFLTGCVQWPTEKQSISDLRPGISFKAQNTDLLEGIQNIFLLGDYDESIIFKIKSLCNLNIQSGLDLSMIDLNTLVLLKGNLMVDLDLHHSIRVVSESQLLEKFY